MIRTASDFASSSGYESPQKRGREVNSKRLAGWMALLGMVCTFATPAQADWTVEMRDAGHCFLKSGAQEMDDGYRKIMVHVELDGDELSLVTPSNIDNSFADLRIQVDREGQIKSSEVVDNKTVRFTGISAQTIRSMKKGLTLKAWLRFWPTWPATGSHPVAFSLNGFTAATRELATCG
jgi:hypothetical protein